MVSETEDGVTELDARIAALDDTMAGAAGMSDAFRRELRQMQSELLYTGREARGMSRAIGSGVRRAFDGVVFDGMRLSDALRQVAESMVNAAYSTAMRPVQSAVGGAVTSGINSLVSGLLPFEKGGVISQGRVTPFARGGVVRGPVTFPMRGGTGLMGEAGPEAIVPLRRGPDGSLGVAAGGAGRPVNITMNVSTPDVQSFRRSQSQIAAQMSRAMARGQRNR